MSKPTPGPWFYGMGYTVRQTDEAAVKSGMKWGHSVAHIHCDPPCPSREEIEANGFLIATAPDLLAFAEQCANDQDDRVSPGIKDFARNLVAKAKGES